MSDDLRNADLSHLTLEQMTPAQRGEIKRRYDVFVETLPQQKVKLKLPPSPDLPRWAPTKTASSKSGPAKR